MREVRAAAWEAAVRGPPRTPPPPPRTTAAWPVPAGGRIGDAFPVVVTSYEILLADIKFMAKYQWKYIVVDEVGTHVYILGWVGRCVFVYGCGRGRPHVCGIPHMCV